MLREWATRTYPNLPIFEQFRLGPTVSHLVGVTVTPALEAALRVNNWYADAVIFPGNETVIIEAKVKPTPSAVSQVQFYAGLLGRTPQMQNRLHLPVTQVVLFAENDPVVTAFAQTHGVRVAVYTPSWIADYLQLVQFRWRTATLRDTSTEPNEG